MNEKSNMPSLRAAIYLHSPVDHSEPNSLEDQERKCRAAAASHVPAWSIADEHVFRDSGTCDQGVDRPRLKLLLQKAAEDNRPFEIVVVQNTVILGRRFSMVLDIVEALERRGIGVYFAEQMLDSKDDFFTTLASLTRKWCLPQQSTL